MFEYHGWVTIQATASGDDDAALLERLVDLRWSAGIPMLHFGGFDKHGGQAAELLTVFTRAGELAPGSYGLLHTWDDQDTENDNNFRVYRMARGQVTEREDPHLTPVAPTILDTYEL